MKQMKVRGKKKKYHALLHHVIINGAESVIGCTESLSSHGDHQGHKNQLFLVVIGNCCNVTQIITNKDHPAFQMVNVETNCFDIKFVHAACPTSMI